MKIFGIEYVLLHVAFWGIANSLSTPPDISTKSSSRRTFLGKSTVLVIGGIATANNLPKIVDNPSTIALAADDTTKRIKKPTFYVPPIPLTDKLVVITGGTTGLGLESAKRLAAAGASVVVTARTQQKGEDAVNSINEYVKEQQATTTPSVVAFVTLELCDLSDVKSFPQRLEKVIGSNKKIDVLMNNAGVMALPDRVLTKDGYEKTFQTNHLGHFALTAKIVPSLAQDARIINVSSEAYQFAAKGIDFDNLQGEKEYGPWSSYGYSKLENIYFTKELQRRFDASNSDKTAFTLHPGAVQTDLARYLIGEEKMNEMKANGMSMKDKVIFGALAKLTKSVQDGASTQVFLAASSASILANDKGKFFNDMKPVPLKGPPEDQDKALELWRLSESLADVKFDI